MAKFILMRLLANLFSTATVLLLSLGLHAHEYWIETIGSHKVNEPVMVRLYFGEHAVGTRMAGKSLDKMKDIHMSVVNSDGSKQALAMAQRDSFWEGSFTPQATGSYEIVGINDEREVQDWTKHNLGIVRPIQYLRSTYIAGKKVTSQGAGLYLDANIKKASKGKYQFSIVKEGKTVQPGMVTVSSFGGKEQTLDVDANGNATFAADKDGVYLVSIEWIDKTPGEFKEKKYETIRHRLDLTLYN